MLVCIQKEERRNNNLFDFNDVTEREETMHTLANWDFDLKQKYKK